MLQILRKRKKLRQHRSEGSSMDYENNLTEEEIEEIEKDMEKRISRSSAIGDFIEFFVIILIILAIFFPDILTNIYHTISGAIGLIL